MGDNIHIIARTAVHAAEQRYGQVKLTNVHALLEVDPRNTRAAPWRVQAATKRGSLLVEELGNNGYQAAKWVAGSFLSGVDQIRLGFVSRTNQDSNDSHKLLGMQSFEPAVLAHQMSLSSSNMWGVLKWAIMLVRKNAELLRGDEDEDSFAAKFVLLKDPNQPMVALYTVPLDEFDEEESEDEDSDEDDNEEEL